MNCARACFCLCLLCLCGVSQPLAPVIDKTLGENRTTLGPPSLSFTVVLGQNSDTEIMAFPVRIAFASARIASDRSVIVEVTLTNTGPTSLRIPTSLDQVKAHTPGTKERTELSIFVQRVVPGDVTAPEDPKAVEVLFASKSRPESFYLLQPKQSVSLRVAAPINTLGLHANDQIRVYVHTLSLEDQRLAVSSQSKMIPYDKLVDLTSQ